MVIFHFRVPYSQRYLFNAVPDTNHNANPINPNRNSKGNPNTTNLTNLLTLILGTIMGKSSELVQYAMLKGCDACADMGQL